MLAAPLVKIKQAITRTRQEVSQMDIRVGLLQHILLRQSLNAKLQLRDTAAAYWLITGGGSRVTAVTLFIG